MRSKFRFNLFDIFWSIVTLSALSYSPYFFVITSGKILFHPYIQADEKVAAAHFLDFELGYAMPAVTPGNGDGGESIAAHDGLKRQFHCDVEMRREDRPNSVDQFLPVGFEGISRVVQTMAKKEAHEEICKTINEKLDPRVVDHATAALEAAAENAVVALVQLDPVCSRWCHLISRGQIHRPLPPLGNLSEPHGLSHLARPSNDLNKVQPLLQTNF